MVAGGRARSARPPDQMCGMEVRPRMGSRIKYQAAWIPSATAAAVGKSGRVRVSGGLALRARPPATLRDAIRRRNRGFARACTASRLFPSASQSLVPRPSSLVPRPSSLVSRLSSLVPRPSSLVPRPSSLVPASSPCLPASFATNPGNSYTAAFFRDFRDRPAPRVPRRGCHPNQSQDRGSSQCLS